MLVNQKMSQVALHHAVIAPHEGMVGFEIKVNVESFVIITFFVNPATIGHCCC